MAQMLAIEWDSSEARLVLGRTARQDVLIERAVAVKFPTTDEGETCAPEVIGETLRSAIAEQGLSAPKVLLGIRRADVELKQLSLPPAPDAELPELVGHQAARELSSHAAGTRLDFVPLDDDAAQSRRVIAAALSGEQAERTDAILKSGGVSPQRWLLQSYETASLVIRRSPELRDGCLLVELFEREAALTAIVAARVVFLRSVRLSGDEAGLDMLVPEIRRTLLAVKGQALGGQVESICILGGPDEHGELIEHLSDELSLEVGRLDPFDGVKLASELQANPPDHPGRFAALVGMMAVEAADERHAIDFLNPRRPPVPRNRRRMIGIASAVVAALFLFVVYGGWSQIREANARIEQKREESKSLDALVKRAQEKRLVAETIGNWIAGEIVWLDELRDLSLRFPSPRDAVILRLSMAGLPASRRTDDVQGAIDMDVLVRDSSLIDRMATNLTDDSHRVDTGQVKRVKGSGDERANPWQFDATISVAPSETEQYVRRLANVERVTATRRVDEAESLNQAIIDEMKDDNPSESNEESSLTSGDVSGGSLPSTPATRSTSATLPTEP